MNRLFVTAAIVAGLAFSATVGKAIAAEKTLKFSTFGPVVSFTTPMHKDIGERLSAATGGRLAVEYFFSGSMGPTERHYQLARDGVADFTFFHTGFTPGLFPLTELIQLPDVLPNDDVGTVVIQELLERYIAAEFRGVRLISIFSGLRSSLFTPKKAVASLDDLKGMRIRANSKDTARLLSQLGAVPVALPPTGIAEALEKGTVDGIVTDESGVFAFKLGELLKYQTPIFRSVVVFVVAMNERAYQSLNPEFRKAINGLDVRDTSFKYAKNWTKGTEKLYLPYLKKNGVEQIAFDPTDESKINKASKDLAAARVQALEGKGLPARAFWAQFNKLVSDYAPR